MLLHLFRSVHIRTWFLCFCITTLTACNATDEQVNNELGNSAHCQPPKGLHITDINSVTDWINALPKPTTLPCFIQSLPRPLKVTAAVSTLSAQESVGQRSPRVFIFINDLILSVTMSRGYILDQSDEGQTDLLELALVTPPPANTSPNQKLYTIKGEYKFPVLDRLAYSAPYSHIALSGSASVCAICHANETQVDSEQGVPIYQSIMLQPAGLIVDMDSMYAENANCNPVVETHRCRMFSALLDGGEVLSAIFPKNASFFR